MIDWAAVAWKVRPFAVEQAKRWWKRDVAKNLGRRVVEDLESDDGLGSRVREQLVVQWWAVRDDPELVRVIAQLLRDPDPEIEPLVGRRLEALLQGLALILGEAATAERLAGAVLRQLGAAQRTPEQVARADGRRTHNKLDLTDRKLDRAQSRLEAIAERLEQPSQAAAMASGARRQVRFNLPLGVAEFTGRRRELACLDNAFRDTRLVVVAQAITGPGGVGKTELAARYVHEHVDAYDIVAWITAEDSAVADLSAFALELKIDVTGLSPADCAAGALRWLEVCDERWLLVLDNVSSAEDLQGCCPRCGNGRVIITTRDRSMAQYATTLEVDVFDESTAVEYLVARARRPDDHEAARRVAVALGCLPLALAHAGAYCQWAVSFDSYLHLLHEMPTRELFDPRERHARTVASTWRPSIAAACERAPLAGRMLTMAAFLAPDAIARALFDVLHEQPTSASGRKALGDAFDALGRFSLADIDDNTFRVHRLLQKTIRDDTAANVAAKAACDAVHALLAAFPPGAEAPINWPTAERLLAHVLAVADSVTPEHPAGGGVVRLLNRAAHYLISVDRTNRSVQTATRAHAYAQALLGNEHRETMTARRYLAVSLRFAGRLADSIAIGEDLSSGSERILGARDPDTLSVRASLANSYRLAGRPAEAVALGERVVADRERILGGEHPDTLSCRSNLASSYWAAGRTADAIELGEGVMADRERILGSEHHDTLTTRSNLANSYWTAGRISDAIELGQRALDARDRLLGENHPDSLSTRANLANAYRSAGRIARAIAVGEQVLKARVRILGEEHPDTLTARANLANSYQSAGRTADAIELQEHVLAAGTRMLGEDHPHVATWRASLALMTASASTSGPPAS